MELITHTHTLIAILGSLGTFLATIVGVWINVSKYRKEVNKERLKLIETVNTIKSSVDNMSDAILEIKEQNDEQQKEIESTREFTKSHFRMELYKVLTTALERGYTTVGEATEITKMYSIYTKQGGNGEIELLYSKYDKLIIKEDKL